MLYEKGVNWNDLDSVWKNGSFINRNLEGIFEVNHDVEFKKANRYMEIERFL